MYRIASYRQAVGQLLTLLGLKGNISHLIGGYLGDPNSPIAIHIDPYINIYIYIYLFISIT